MDPAGSLQARVAEEIRALLARRRLSARKAAHALGWTEVGFLQRAANTELALLLARELGKDVRVFHPADDDAAAGGSAAADQSQPPGEDRT